jgi:hypothetical protein
MEPRQLPLLFLDDVQRAQLREAEHGPREQDFVKWVQSLPPGVTLHLGPPRES